MTNLYSMSFMMYCMYLIEEPSRSRSAIVMADSDCLKGENPHISGNVKFILLSREERSVSIVQPYLIRVVVSTVKNDVDVGIGAGSRACSCQRLHLVGEGLYMCERERKRGVRERERGISLK
jgi:hypothetical protein